MWIFLVVLGLAVGVLLGRRWGQRAESRAPGSPSRQGEALRVPDPSFVGRLAHELRSPLGALSSSLGTQERALARLETDPEAPEFRASTQALITARAALVQIEDLVNALQTAGRVRTEQEQPTPARALVDAAIVLAGHRLGRIRIEREDTPGVQVRVVPGQIVRVLVNLLANAARALPDGGRVRIETRLRTEWAEIVVSDSGTGIAPEEAGRVFDEGYTRWDSGEKGEGYGLPVCREMTRDHGGDIVLGKTDLGGASFVVRLPAFETGGEQELPT